MMVAWDQDTTCVGSEKWSDSGYILRMKPVRCVDRLDVEGRENDDFTVFGMSNWKNKIAFPEMGKTVGVAGMGKIKYICESVDIVRTVSQLTFSEQFLREEPRNRCSGILLVKCSC